MCHASYQSNSRRAIWRAARIGVALAISQSIAGFNSARPVLYRSAIAKVCPLGVMVWAMKFDELRSIGHNIADSLASGIGLLVGVYEMDVFGEARRSPARCIVVDFLSGKVIEGRASPSLARAIELYGEALPNLCEKHRVSLAMFRELTARYSVDAQGPRFVVTVEDCRDRRAVDEYVGVPGRRIRILDHLGRVRRKRNRVVSSRGVP